MKKIHKGDDGYTEIRGSRVSKDSPVIEFIGGLDELVSFLGLVRSVLSRDSLLNTITTNLKNIQTILMSIASIVAGKVPDDATLLHEYVNSIEREIEVMNGKVSSKQCLVIPGSTYESSLLHFARALCRSVERRAIPLLKDGILNRYAYVYLNRLSDLLYLYSLYVDTVKGTDIECMPEVQKGR